MLYRYQTVGGDIFGTYQADPLDVRKFFRNMRSILVWLLVKSERSGVTWLWNKIDGWTYDLRFEPDVPFSELVVTLDFVDY